ncbi:MAG: dephospho-CoA kinase [Planctomycetes bacterium]|nr:dephospho-CoA kinase [Planctomycetota bacterium]
MITIGLYSDIGSGKSFVAEIFRNFGAFVINADREVAKLLVTDDIKTEIQQHFPDAVHENTIDKGYLARTVFANKAKLIELEEIIHPPVKKILWQKYHEAEKNNTEILVLDVPLLYDSEFEDICDVRIFIDTKDDVRFDRLQKNRGLCKDEVLKREKFQPAHELKLQKADFVITNSDDKLHTEEQVKQILTIIKKNS